MTENTIHNSLKLVFEKQIYHYLSVIPAIIILFLLTTLEPVTRGSFLSLSTTTWYWISIATPIVHQIFVGFLWRMEFHRNSLTKRFGYNGFVLFGILFFIFFFGRYLTVILLSISNMNTLGIDIWISIIIGVILIFPVLYLIYSLKRYFGFKRALGADHFFEEYRKMPLVKEGIYKYTSHAMYAFGFLPLWMAGLFTGSLAAIIVAAFNHLYIWVHYYTTEKPDMKRIYG